MIALHAIRWTEYERGWGQRPDGISFYASKERAEQHRTAFLAARNPNKVPDEYSDPGKIEIMEVSRDLYDLVHRRGMRWMHFNSQKAAMEYVLRPQDDPEPTIDELLKSAGELLSLGIINEGELTALQHMILEDPKAAIALVYGKSPSGDMG